MALPPRWLPDRPAGFRGHLPILGARRPTRRGRAGHARRKLALNYRFGGGADPRPWLTPAGIVVGAPEHGACAVEIEVSGRYVHGWGRFKQDLAGSTGLPANNSRLTWKDVETDGGEVFWRLDTPHRVMVKGLWGTGTGNGGRINDEDSGLDREDDEGNLVVGAALPEHGVSSRRQSSGISRSTSATTCSRAPANGVAVRGLQLLPPDMSAFG